MELQFTRDVGARFKRGDVRDYPRATWEQIERSTGRKLESFTRSVVQPLEDKSRKMVAREDAMSA